MADSMDHILRYRLAPLAFATTLLALGSCSAMHTVPVAEVTTASPASPGRFTRFSTAQGQRVFGYTTKNGRFHSFRGQARLQSDTMTFYRPESQSGWPAQYEPAVTERVAVADLESVRSEAVASLPTAILISVLVGVAALLVVGGIVGSGLGS